MDAPSSASPRLATTVRTFAQRLLTIGGNRLELLTVEVQEERERLLHAVLMALAMAVSGLLAAMALSAAVVIGLWPYSPIGVLAALTAIYGTAGGVLFLRLRSHLKNWQAFPDSLDQLRKDRASLGEQLG